jgi:GNAT superfamily N-acetyltransferase
VSGGRAAAAVPGAGISPVTTGISTNEAIEVRHLSGSEVPLMLEWARDEGWNPGLHDASSFHAADPGGFLTSLHDGKPAAVISLVRHDDAFAFLGLYICRPQLRGRGYGMRVWEAALEFAGDRVIGLDGVPEQQANYRRSGFELAWQNARFQGTGGGTRPDGLVNLETVPLAEVLAFDHGVFEADRQQYLRGWIAQPDAVRLAVRRDGRLTGWGLLRPCAVGWKIGPLLANDEETATRLLDGLLASVPGETVSLDVPLPNTVAVRAATDRGMVEGFSTARMYKGTPPALDLDRIWGVTSFELG